MAEIAVLKTHIVNYAKTHPVYDAYRKAGYNKKFLDRPFRFHASGTQRTYSTTNIGVMPLTLAPKCAPDFRRECALTHSIAFGKNAQPAPERCRSERVWDFPTSILQRKICICAHECTACQSYLSRQNQLDRCQFDLGYCSPVRKNVLLIATQENAFRYI